MTTKIVSDSEPAKANTLFFTVTADGPLSPSLTTWNATRSGPLLSCFPPGSCCFHCRRSSSTCSAACRAWRYRRAPMPDEKTTTMTCRIALVRNGRYCCCRSPMSCPFACRYCVGRLNWSFVRYRKTGPRFPVRPYLTARPSCCESLSCR